MKILIQKFVVDSNMYILGQENQKKHTTSLWIYYRINHRSDEGEDFLHEVTEDWV